MLNLIQRQTDWYLNAANKMDEIHKSFGNSFTPVGIHKKTGRIVKVIELRFGYTKWNDINTFSPVGVFFEKIIDSVNKTANAFKSLSKALAGIKLQEVK